MKLRARSLPCKQKKKVGGRIQTENIGDGQSWEGRVAFIRMFSLAVFMFENVPNRNVKTTHLWWPVQVTATAPSPGKLGPSETWREMLVLRRHQALGAPSLRQQPPTGPPASGDCTHRPQVPAVTREEGPRTRSPGRCLSAQVAQGRLSLFEPRPLDSASSFMTPTCRMGQSGPWACRGSTPCRTYCIRATASPCTVTSTSTTTTSSMTLP